MTTVEPEKYSWGRKVVAREGGILPFSCSKIRRKQKSCMLLYRNIKEDITYAKVDLSFRT